MTTADALWDRSYDEKAIGFLELAKASTILDLGCGSGMWTGTLQRLQRKARVVGIDLDKSALKRALENLDSKADFVLADASHIPFKEGSFDLVTCRRLLINLGTRARSAVIREMMRVARENGLVSSVEPSLHSQSATHFITVRGGLRFSQRLEKKFSDTDFRLGPQTPYIFLREGLANVKVWGYLTVYSVLPPDYEPSFLSSVVHSGFEESLMDVESVGKAEMRCLRGEAKKLDRKMGSQKARGEFVNVSAIPWFITRGTKRNVGMSTGC